MEINTKFNIGDELFTIDKKTAKAVKFKVGRIFVHVPEKGTPNVEYFGEDLPLLEGTYNEDVCFASMDELVAHIACGIEE